MRRSPGVKMSTGQRVSELSADTLGPTVPRMLVGIQLHRLRDAQKHSNSL